MSMHMVSSADTDTDQHNFFRAYGGGKKKILDQVNKLKLGDYGEFEFTLRDTAPLQEMVSYLVNENTSLRERLDSLTLQPPTISLPKPRYRVKAGSSRTPTAVTSVSPAQPACDFSRYDADIRLELQRFPTKTWMGRVVIDHKKLSIEEARKLGNLRMKQQKRTARRRKAK